MKKLRIIEYIGQLCDKIQSIKSHNQIVSPTNTKLQKILKLESSKLLIELGIEFVFAASMEPICEDKNKLYSKSIIVMSVTESQFRIYNDDFLKEFEHLIFSPLMRADVYGSVFIFVDDNAKESDEVHRSWGAFKKKIAQRCRFIPLFVTVAIKLSFHPKGSEITHASKKILLATANLFPIVKAVLSPIEKTVVDNCRLNGNDEKLLTVLKSIEETGEVEKKVAKEWGISPDFIIAIQKYFTNLATLKMHSAILQKKDLDKELLIHSIPSSLEVNVLMKENKAYYKWGWTTSRLYQTIQFLDYLGVKEGDFANKRVLEIGPGLCDFIKIAQYLGAVDIFAIDKNIVFLELAKLRGTQVYELHLESSSVVIPQIGSIDLFWCKGFLNAHHFDDKTQLRNLIASIDSLLSPSAKAFWTTYNTVNPGAKKSDLKNPVKVLKDCFFEFGWNILQVDHVLDKKNLGLNYHDRVESIIFIKQGL